MKYSIISALLLFAIYFSSCTPDPFPAEDCFITYTLEDIEYTTENIEFSSGLEIDNLLINHSFENGGSITMIANDWTPATGLVENVSFIVYGSSSNLYFLESGTINITTLEENYFSGTFVDGEGFIKDGEFTLRYSEL